MPNNRKLAAIALAAAAGYMLEASMYLKEENAIVKRRKKRRCWVKKRNNGDVESTESEPHYTRHFHMGTGDFEAILDYVAKDITKKNTPMRLAYPAKAKLEATLRFLAAGESYRRLGVVTNLSAPFLSSNIPLVCEAIYQNLKNDYIKMPSTTADWIETSEYFLDSFNFPLCLGAICEKQLLFRPFRMGENWNNNQSITILTVTDFLYNIVYVEIDCNGQSSGKSFFERSKLKEILESPNANFPQNTSLGNHPNVPYMFVGDRNIPLHERVLVPYETEADDKKNQLFNHHLNEITGIFERSFALLTHYFKITQTANVKKEQIKSIILACFALHNFLLADTCQYEYALWHSDLDGCDEPKPGKFLKYDVNPRAEEIRTAFAEYFSKPSE